MRKSARCQTGSRMSTRSRCLNSSTSGLQRQLGDAVEFLAELRPGVGAVAGEGAADPGWMLAGGQGERRRNAGERLERRAGFVASEGPRAGGLSEATTQRLLVVGAAPAAAVAGAGAVGDAAGWGVGVGEESSGEAMLDLGVAGAEQPGHAGMDDPLGGFGVAVGVVADRHEHGISRGARGGPCWRVTRPGVSRYFKVGGEIGDVGSRVTNHRCQSPTRNAKIDDP